MRITLRLFAAAREAAGWEQRELDLPAGATLAEARSHVGQLLPGWPLLASSALAVNQRFARPEQPLVEGDEIAVLPPVSGG
jgi:molybdopterin converting factor subunit 1